MTRTNQILGGLLVVQLVLGIVTWKTSEAAESPAKKLVPYAKDAVTEIDITPPSDSESSQPLKLVRKDGDWTIDTLDGFPADAGKVGTLVDKLVGIEVHNPIATTKASFDSLKVGDDEYGVEVTIEAGSDSEDLLLGTASSNSAHVRVGGTSKAYDTHGLTVFDASTRPVRYVDLDYVKASPTDIVSLKVSNGSGTFTMSKADDGKWTVADAPDGKVVDQTQAGTLVSKLASLRITEPLGKSLPEYGLDQPRMAVQWMTKDGDTTASGGYVIGAEETGKKKAYAAEQNSPFAVAVSESGLKDLQSATEARLLTDAPPPGATQPATPGMSTPSAGQ